MSVVSNASGNQHLADAEIGPDTTPELRQSTRTSLFIQAAKLITDQHENICILKDVSVEGLKIRHFGEVPDGNHLEIGLANDEALPVEFVWKDETDAGFRFKDAVDTSHIVKLTNNDRARRKVRLKVDACAKVSWGSQVALATITNLSQQGASVECSELLLKDQIVRLDIDGMPTIYAKVRWRRGSAYGLVFENTLSFEELAAAMAKLNKRDGR